MPRRRASAIALVGTAIVAVAACSIDRSGTYSREPATMDAMVPPPPTPPVVPPASDAAPDVFVVVDSGPDAPRPDLGPATECTDGATRCAADHMQRCNLGRWNDGPACHLGCADSTRCRILVPSHVSPSLLDPGAPDLVIDRATVIDTEMCAGGRVEPQTDGSASRVCVLPVGRFYVGAVRLTVVGRYPLVILAASDAELDSGSEILLSAAGIVAGAGGSPSGFGANPGGPGGEVDGSDGGGGGGGLCGAGGRGGDGLEHGALGGLAGFSFGSFPGRLVGGSGGGSGGAATGPVAARGGAGGGAIQITAQGTLTMRGRIMAAGGGGEGGLRPDGVSDTGAGGGGGSGGMVFLEANLIVDEGVYLGTGGGGGGGGASNDGSSGGPGSDGESSGDLAPAPGGTTGGGSYGAPGAEGAADNQPAGSTGPNGEGNGGGGGGGSGCIAFISSTGTFPPGPGQSTPSFGVGFHYAFATYR